MTDTWMEQLAKLEIAPLIAKDFVRSMGAYKDIDEDKMMALLKEIQPRIKKIRPAFSETEAWMSAAYTVLHECVTLLCSLYGEDHKNWPLKPGRSHPGEEIP